MATRKKRFEQLVQEINVHHDAMATTRKKLAKLLKDSEKLLAATKKLRKGK